MKKLIIIRHGIEHNSFPKSIDAACSLTGIGINQCVVAAKILKTNYALTSEDFVLSSEDFKSKQTAQIIMNIMDIYNIEYIKEFNDINIFDDKNIPKLHNKNIIIISDLNNIFQIMKNYNIDLEYIKGKPYIFNLKNNKPIYIPLTEHENKLFECSYYGL
jgi:hypothetical protein